MDQFPAIDKIFFFSINLKSVFTRQVLATTKIAYEISFDFGLLCKINHRISNIKFGLSTLLLNFVTTKGSKFLFYEMLKYVKTYFLDLSFNLLETSAS